MQFSTLFIAAISALTASAAPAAVEERSCQVAYPVNSQYYWVSRYYNPSYEHNQDVVFNIPQGASGACDLHVKFPNSGYPPSLYGNTQVDFKYLGGTGTTYTFGSEPVDATIGSFGCSELMEFVMTISKEQGTNGYVGFPQDTVNGLYITYNC